MQDFASSIVSSQKVMRTVWQMNGVLGLLNLYDSRKREPPRTRQYPIEISVETVVIFAIQHICAA